LKDKVVVLTGATGRLGRHYADVISETGAHVVLVDLDQSACEALAEELASRHGTSPLGVSVDITDKDAVFQAVEGIIDRYGEIDILINNAAAQQLAVFDGDLCSFVDFPLEVWQSNLDVNLTGAFLCCQAVGRNFEERGAGVILNIGSIYGVVACDQRIYGDTGINSSIACETPKRGLINFARYLASWWQGKNIRVNCVSPGGVFNDQGQPFLDNYLSRTMLKRMANPDDLASAVLFLISDASGWITGENLIVDGGWSAW
jgi:NAD(P)-dependent dehydrogenase (short-subunit alcohol dehydrogenase family)